MSPKSPWAFISRKNTHHNIKESTSSTPPPIPLPLPTTPESNKENKYNSKQSGLFDKCQPQILSSPSLDGNSFSRAFSGITVGVHKKRSSHSVSSVTSPLLISSITPTLSSSTTTTSSPTFSTPPIPPLPTTPPPPTNITSSKPILQPSPLTIINVNENIIKQNQLNNNNSNINQNQNQNQNPLYISPPVSPKQNWEKSSPTPLKHSMTNYTLRKSTSHPSPTAMMMDLGNSPTINNNSNVYNSPSTPNIKPPKQGKLKNSTSSMSISSLTHKKSIFNLDYKFSWSPSGGSGSSGLSKKSHYKETVQQQKLEIQDYQSKEIEYSQEIERLQLQNLQQSKSFQELQQQYQTEILNLRQKSKDLTLQNSKLLTLLNDYKSDNIYLKQQNQLLQQQQNPIPPISLTQSCLTTDQSISIRSSIDDSGLNYSPNQSSPTLQSPSPNPISSPILNQSIIEAMDAIASIEDAVMYIQNQSSQCRSPIQQHQPQQQDDNSIDDLDDDLSEDEDVYQDLEKKLESQIEIQPQDQITNTDALNCSKLDLCKSMINIPNQCINNNNNSNSNNNNINNNGSTPATSLVIPSISTPTSFLSAPVSTASSTNTSPCIKAINMIKSTNSLPIPIPKQNYSYLSNSKLGNFNLNRSACHGLDSPTKFRQLVNFFENSTPPNELHCGVNSNE